jgi:CDP-glycerol glycerophosphotransferase (TagB/SpsB family)
MAGASMNLKRRVINLLHPLYLLSTLVPKSPSIWIFGAWFGHRFADNPRQLFLYATSQQGLDCVWITRSFGLARQIRAEGYKAFHYASLFGLYYQLRAGAAFFTHDRHIDMLGPAISSRTLRFQLWHGTPLKKIRYGNDKNEGRSRAFRRNLRFRIFPWSNDVSYDFVPAASELSIDHLKEAFRTRHVHVTGYPRNDILQPGRIDGPRRPIRRCIYMPTFRGGFRDEQSSILMRRYLEDSGFVPERLDQELTAMGVTLVLRLHPTNDPGPDLVARVKATSSIRLDDTDEIYDQLNDYDLLITDYSSVFFDFLLTGKPIIHAAFDLDDYKTHSRDLYFDYDDVSLTPQIRTWDDVIATIRQFHSGGIPLHYAARYEALAARFNQFRDGDSSRRVYEWARARLG